MKFVLLGDTTVGQEALLRFYVLHVAVLPAVLVLLIAIHFWRVRKDGGLSRPEQPKSETKTETIVATMTLEPAKKRVYGLQGFVRGNFTKVGNVPDDTVYAWPNLLLAELFVFVLTVSLILLVSLAFNAPLEEPVNVMHPPNPAKAPWYFLGLQEMVSYSAFWGGIGIPGLMVALLLIVPYPQGCRSRSLRTPLRRRECRTWFYTQTAVAPDRLVVRFPLSLLSACSSPQILRHARALRETRRLGRRCDQ